MTDLIEKMAKEFAEKHLGLHWQCVCSENRGDDCDCGDAMQDERVDRHDEEWCRDDCRSAMRTALSATGLTAEQIEGIASGEMVILTRAEANLAREWADAVEDLHKQYLEEKDFALRKKLRAMIAAKEAP